MTRSKMRRREQDDLAREGYRFYAREAEEFAEMSVQAMAEVMCDDPGPPSGRGFAHGVA